MGYKTVKLKVELNKESIDKFNTVREEMKWVWNVVRAFALHNHTPIWYKWAEKSTTNKLFGGYDFENIIRVPIHIGDSAFVGATCRIATGGNYWQKDESIKIAYKYKNETRYKHGYRLVEGDKPWKPIEPKEFEYRKINNVEIKKSGDLDRLKLLNYLRSHHELPVLTSHSDYIGGLIKKDFDIAWKAFLSSDLKDRAKPKYKRESSSTITNVQQSPKNKGNNIMIPGIGMAKLIGKQKFPHNAKTYTLTKSPSGYYLNVSYVDEVVLKPAKESNVCGIDPGVKSIIALDNGQVFEPNIARDRIQRKIEYLQNKLGLMEDVNDKRFNRNRNNRKSLRTKNEQKLYDRIARLHERARISSKSFNQKLSTRIARTYRKVYIENTMLKNMRKAPEAKVSGEFDGYEENGANAKAGLNKSLSISSIGQLREMIQKKVIERDGIFTLVPSQNTSITCHNCGNKDKSQRIDRNTFVCNNASCELHKLPQNADVNAAKNIKQWKTK